MVFVGAMDPRQDAFILPNHARAPGTSSLPVFSSDRVRIKGSRKALERGRNRHFRQLAGQGAQFCTGMARPEGFEPPTPRFVVWCSIQLSYGRVALGAGNAAAEMGLRMVH